MKLKSLAAPAYALALIMIVVPVVDTVLSVIPLHTGEVSWRYGAIGLMSRSLLTPIIGLVFALALSLALEHRRVQRAVGIAGIVSVIVMLAMIVLFLLDSLQLSSRIPLAGKSAFMFAGTGALVKFVLFSVVLILIARAGIARPQSTQAAEPADGILIPRPRKRGSSA
jgi:hypothetical protein